MNKHQIKGSARQAMGQAKEQVGRATGDSDLRARGQAKELAGKAQRKLGDAKEAVRERLEDMDDAHRTGAGRDRGR